PARSSATSATPTAEGRGPGAGPGRAACATICAESTAPSSWRTGLRGAQICAARGSARGTDLRGAHASCGRIRRDSREYFAMDPPAGDTQPPGQLPTCGRPQTVAANGDFCAPKLYVVDHFSSTRRLTAPSSALRSDSD